MLQNKLRASHIMLILVISLTIFLFGFTEKINMNPQNVYKVLVDGEVVGTIKSKSEFEEYVNIQEEKIIDSYKKSLEYFSAHPKMYNRILKVYLKEEESKIKKFRNNMYTNNKLIKTCRTYMKEPSIPASREDSIYRMNLVSDLLAYTMRDNNYMRAQIARGKGEPENELDKKIREHKNRLENKPGALERKLEKENKRLERDLSILDYINKNVSLCDSTIEVLNNTKGGRLFTSDEYDNFMNKLEKGKRLGPKTSINQFMKFLNELEKASEEYEKWHDSPFGGPVTNSGQTRLRLSQEFKKYGNEVSKCIDSKSLYIVDKDKPISLIILEREAKIASIKSKNNIAIEAAPQTAQNKIDVKKPENKLDKKGENKVAESKKKTNNKQQIRIGRR